MGDDRPIRYVEGDGTVVYRASGLGVCDGVILGLAAGRKPNKIPDWLMEVFEEGHTAEPHIIEKLLNERTHLGDGVLETQPEFELEVGEINDRRVIVRSHADGYNPGEAALIEVKKFRDSTWPKFLKSGVECNDLYPWQVSSMMHAIRDTAGDYPTLYFTGGHWSGDEGDPVSEIHTFTHHDPPIPLKAIRKRIARWENMIADGIDVTDLDSCSSRQFPCAMFGKGCPEEAKADDATLALTGEHADVARTLGEQWAVQTGIIKTANQMIEAAKVKQKAYAEGIEGLLEDLGDTESMKVKAHGYTFSHVKTAVAAKEVKGYDMDYWKMTAPKKGPEEALRG